MSEEATLDKFVEDDSERNSEFVETAAGQLPVDWDTKNVEELCALRNGKATNHAEIGEQPFLVYGSNGPIGSYLESNFDGGLIFGRVGAVGEVERIREPVWVSDNAIQATVTDKCNTDFIYYYLSNNELGSLATKTAQPLLNQSTIGNVTVPSPPLPEQRKIATVLYTVDRAIEKTESIIQQAKRTKQGLVEEIVTGGIGTEEYKSMRVGPHEFEIPTHWDIVSISESCENLDSERIPVSKSNRENMRGEIPYYGASGCVDYVDDYLFDEPLILLAEDGENLRSRTQRVAFKITGKSWVNNHAHVLRPKDGFELDYLVEYLERLDYRPYVSGSAQPKLNQTMLNKITVPKPSLEEQIEIASILNEFKNDISYETDYLDRLKRLKRGLMQDLLSGTVRTTDTNIEVPDEIAQYG